MGARLTASASTEFTTTIADTTTTVVALLEKVDFNAARDHLILAGDFTCKGKDSYGTIALAQSLNASCVRGNHEAKLLAAYANRTNCFSVDFPSTTAASLAFRLPLSDLKWLSTWPAILNLGAIPGLPHKSVVVVHAGIACDTKLEEQDPMLVMNMRSMNPKTHQAFEDRKDGMPWSTVWNEVQKTLPEHQRTLVIYGHDSKAGLVEREYSIGLDSGCVKGGRLSAFVIEIGASATKTQIVSVKSRQRTARLTSFAST